MSELSPHPTVTADTQPASADLTQPPTRQNPTESDTFFDSAPPAPESPLPTPATSPLTPRQQTAISLLTAGETISSAAAVLGVHRCTLHAWKNDPAFAAELARRQDEVTRAADARLRLLMLQSTHHALASLHAEDPEDRWRNAFRLLSILRPYRTALNTPDPTSKMNPQNPTKPDSSPVGLALASGTNDKGEPSA